MKLSRIEPFTATPETNSEAELVEAEIHAAGMATPPVQSTAEETPVNKEGKEHSPMASVVRLEDFLKKVRKQKAEVSRQGLELHRQRVLSAYQHVRSQKSEENQKAQMLNVSI